MKTIKQLKPLIGVPGTSAGFGRLLAEIVFAASLMVLAGWVLDVGPLKTLGLRSAVMSPVTALLFLSSAAALVVLGGTPGPVRMRAARILGAVVGAIGLVTVAGFLAWIGSGRLWSPARLPILSLFITCENCMSLIGAALFAIFGFAIVLLAAPGRRAHNVAHCILAPAAVAIYLILLGYLFHIRRLYDVDGSIGFPTAILFGTLCLSMLLARPGSALICVFAGKAPGARMARVLLPAILILPVIIGWLRILGEHAKLFSSEFGVVLVATIYMACFLSLVWLVAWSVNRADLDRRRAVEKVRESETQFRRMFENHGAVMLLIDPANGGIIDANAAAASFYGFSRDDLRSMRIQQINRLPPEEVSEDRLEAVDGRRNFFEFPHRLADGRLRTVEVYSTPITIGSRPLLFSVIHDVTERKLAEEKVRQGMAALRESEQRVRLKLESILSPGGTIGNLELRDVIDSAGIQTFMEHFYELAQIPMAITDLDGHVLVGIGWQDICTKYHRVNTDSCRNCHESDIELTKEVPPGEFRAYKCKNNMWDMATPIVVGERKLGNLFIGQFFFDDEEIDAALFASQAEKNGFDSDEYLAALRKVPRISRRNIEHAKAFFCQMAEMLSRSSYSNIKLARSVAQGETLARSLQETQERIAAIFNGVTETVWLMDLEGTILAANQTAAQRLGMSVQEVIGKNCYDLIPADVGERRKLRVAEMVRTNGLVRFEDERAGITFDHAFYPVRDDQGNIIQLAIFSRDITGLKSAERALRVSEERFRLALNAANSGTWEWDLATNESIWSEGIWRLYGLDPASEASYESWLSSVHPDDRERTAAAVLTAATTGTRLQVEWRVRPAESGPQRWLLSIGQPLLDASGKPYRYRGIVLDITQRKKLELERETVMDFLRLVNDSKSLTELIRNAVDFIREKSGFEAVGLRLKRDGDYPYYETRGLSPEFVHAESTLCSRDATGKPRCDARGYPIMECMCGNVIQGRFDSAKEFFSERGSFWTGCTTRLLATSSPEDRLARTRNRCNGEGYQSVGLFALRVGEETLGLLQLNDRREGMFTPETIALWERLADYLAVAVAKTIAEESVRRSARRFELLSQTANDLLRTMRPQQLIETLCARVMEHLDCQAFFNFLVDKGAGKLHLNACAGIPRGEARRIEWLDFGTAVCGCAARDNCRIVAEHIATTPDPRTDLVKSYGITAYAAHPIRGQNGQVIGTLSFGTKTREAFSEEDLSLMSAVTDQVAVALERMRNLLALRESQTMLLNAQKIARLGSWERDLLKNELTLSDEVYRIFELDKKKFGGTYEAFLERVHPDDRGAVDQAYRQALADRVPCEIDHRLLFADGRIKHVHVQGVTLYDPEGRPVTSMGSVQDITERKQMENEIIHSKEEWVQTFNLMPDLIAILDEHHRIVRVNKAMADKLRVDPDKAIGLHCYRSVHGSERPVSQCPHALMVRDGKFHISEIYEPNLGGYFLVSVTPIYDAEGRLKGGVHVARDITERKIRESELDQLNRTLAALGKSSQAMARAKDEDEYLQEVCRIIVGDCGYAMVWIGYAQEDEKKTVIPVASAGFDEGYLAGMRISWADTDQGRGPTGTAIRTGKICKCTDMLTDPAFLPWREQALERGYASSIVLPLTAGDAVFGALTIYSKQPDGFSPDEEHLLSELTNDLSHGITAIRLAAARDQAEATLRKTADDLARSNKDLEQFAYVASHDLQEPLRAVAGFMGILNNEYGMKLDSEAREYIGYAIEGAERMQRLIHDLLTFSRVGTRGGELKPVPMQVVYDTALKNLHASIQEGAAVISCGELPVIVADELQMIQLLQNLIGNAIKFRSTRRPEITVTAEHRDDRWVFAVGDNGIGIEPQYFARIFLIFQRLHSRSEYSGTGIGLAVCKKIVERHKGAIWVESKPGEGSIFYFSIPDGGAA